MLSIILLTVGLIHESNASPSFSEKKDVNAARYFPEDKFYDYFSEALILEGAFYESDGKTLDARLIIHGTSGFDPKNTLSYGMLIDSDSDFDTGKNGFDYRYKVQWTDYTWTETYERIHTDSPILKEISNSTIDDPFIKNSIGEEGKKHSVELSLELDKIGNPELYAVVFFTEGTIHEKAPLVQYVTSVAAIPPPEFVVKTNPSPIAFESSTEKVFHIVVESEIAETTDIHYNVYSESDNVQITELIENTISLKGGKAEIPVLLHDDGHEDLEVHKIFVDLNPWYDVNPETRNADRGGEIFDSYHFRNQQNAETFTIFWSSLQETPSDLQLPIQIAILLVTGIMVVIALLTYKENAKIANYDRNEKHRLQILTVYDYMQSLLYGTNKTTKELRLNYPKHDTDREEASEGNVTINSLRISDVKSFDAKNILFYESALEHFEAYSEQKNKWELLIQSVVKYNAESNSLKQDIQMMYEKFCADNLPNFKPYGNDQNHVYYMEQIVRKAYEILDADELGNPFDLEMKFEHHMLSHEYPEIEISPDDDVAQNTLSNDDVTLLFSTEPFPDIAYDLLAVILSEPFSTKYSNLMKTKKETIRLLGEFRESIKILVRELSLGAELKGECSLELHSSSKFSSFFKKITGN